MSATATDRRTPAVQRPSFGDRLGFAIGDGLLLTKRNLLRYVRIPTLLVFSTVQPVMFVLLFRYVFGGAISGAGGNYVNYLMPGIFIQTAIFGSTQTGVGLAEDLGKGIIDRFRSLPMARSAVLAGRTTADLFRNLFVVILMLVVGYLVGFRFEEGAAFALMGIGLAVAVGFSFSWISALIGLGIKDVESVQAASFVWIFPFVFASSAFVPPRTFPSWLEAWARVNPVSIWCNTLRAFTSGIDVVRFTTGNPGLTTGKLVLQSTLYVLGILAVFVPLAIRSYRKAS